MAEISYELVPQKSSCEFAAVLVNQFHRKSLHTIVRAERANGGWQMIDNTVKVYTKVYKEVGRAKMIPQCTSCLQDDHPSTACTKDPVPPMAR